MKKLLTFVLSLLLICSLSGCGKNDANSIESNNPTTEEPSITTPIEDTTQETSESDEIMNKTLVLKIDNTEVDVFWADNASVTALKELAKGGLTINMSKYGGFEQVGSLGTSITSADTRITTTAGDIVLYSSNQIVIFYDSNTWAYTKLGHINLSKSELVDLLADEDVTITLSLK
ncbi:MAG: cyclophilin-like fold protein [Acholeplasmatales bacterium]